MEFRWVAAITLWTLLAGPVFDAPLAAPQPRSPRAAAVSSSQAKSKAPDRTDRKVVRR